MKQIEEFRKREEGKTTEYLGVLSDTEFKAKSFGGGIGEESKS
jgi:hypothetical protein